jgi:SAM-dependent methyltransferase
MTDAALYDQPDLYDLTAPANPLAETFYIEEARRQGGAVLDLACGSGRFTIPVARSGLEVVGGDLSPLMLERARTKATAASVEIDFIEMDMREFDLPGRQFGLVIIAANSLLHLHNPHDIRRCFAAIAQHLVPGGALAFDVFVPSVRFLAREPNQRHLVGRFMHDELGELILEETTYYDAASQVNHTTWFWSTPDRPDFFVIPLHMRLLFPQELPLLVEMGGLRLQARYGDFDRSTFGAQSHRQVCICELTPGNKSARLMPPQSRRTVCR